MSYQPQPPTGYHQPYYPPPNYPQQHYYQAPVLRRPANEGMKATAIVLFVVGFGLNILSYFPLIGFVIGFFGLFCYLIGFIFLCLI